MVKPLTVNTKTLRRYRPCDSRYEYLLNGLEYTYGIQNEYQVPLSFILMHNGSSDFNWFESHSGIHPNTQKAIGKRMRFLLRDWMITFEDVFLQLPNKRDFKYALRAIKKDWRSFTRGCPMWTINAKITMPLNSNNNELLWSCAQWFEELTKNSCSLVEPTVYLLLTNLIVPFYYTLTSNDNRVPEKLKARTADGVKSKIKVLIANYLDGNFGTELI